MSSSLLRILGTFDDVPRRFWAELLGASERQLNDWLSGRREFPLSAADALSKAIGVPVEVLRGKGGHEIEPERVLPPLWLKARETHLDRAGYQAVALVRVLAARYHELLSLLDMESNSYRFLFNEIKAGVDPQQPARTQGAIAASAFLDLSTLDKGATGIGEVIRGFLRARGVIILETGIADRSLEGFCVPVGGETRTRPCVVANSYRTTWFRRNYIILHELAHAVFDLEAANAVFDRVEPSRDTLSPSRDTLSNIAEQRADAFAQHCLVPRRLLVAYENRGRKLSALTDAQMAELVAVTHAEQRLIVRAAMEYELIGEDAAQRLSSLRIARHLRSISPHAVGIAQMSEGDLVYRQVKAWGPRLTTFPVEGLRLPIPYVKLVLEAVQSGRIAESKAAELLMITPEELESRYGVQREDPEKAFIAVAS